MFEEMFCNRLIQLRQEKNISTRDMSLSLGQRESYINRIENGKMLPSMTVFFYICDYFGITPREFFDTENASSMELIQAYKQLQAMDDETRRHVIAIIQDLTRDM